MTEWEQYFQKLQHVLIFDENNPDVTEISENENCNKKIIQNDAGSSQNKPHDKHKTHSLDEYAERMEKLRAIPRHLNIDKRKTLDVHPETQKFFHEAINTETQNKNDCQNMCLCNQKYILDWMKKTSLVMYYGKNVTIAKNIMNYI